MAECLGIYLENNLIKYAKLSKERDNIKVESFGIKIAERLQDDIDQIVKETSSSKTPISINLSDEMYNYFDVFAMLSKKDIERAIKTEFDFFCEEKKLNQKTLETRHFLIPSKDDKEKIRAVHISANRVEIAKKNQELQGKMLRSINPLPIALTNLPNISERENFIILNIEEKTTITVVIDGQIYKVHVLEDGMREIFDKINSRENSYRRAYEICKNTTIYTLNSELQESETNEYLEDIIPTLYNIAQKVKQTLGEDSVNIPKMYITGTGALINNIDLYFQDNISRMKIQILRPYFVEANKNGLGIKDYIEVNSAIALALQGLGEGIKGINFKELDLMEKMPSIDLPKLNLGNIFTKKINVDLGLNRQLDRIEKMLLRFAGGLLLLAIIYSVTSGLLSKQLETKISEADEATLAMVTEINKVKADSTKINDRASKYKMLIDNLKNLNTLKAEKNNVKNSIPILLYRIMSTIPKGVQLTSIKNTTSEHIVITAQSIDYQQIGYFKGVLRLEGILNDVKSDNGVKQDGVVKVTIEGDLPLKGVTL